ncbi:hypothetical protein MM710_32380, partial [Klebsiella pneumoniae]|nr:hypothetical protein [Klebsiella pneumoniae]
IVTLEENAEQGGAGGAVLEVLAKHGICKPVLLLGVADTVTGHGDPKKLLNDLGLSAEAVERRVRAWLSDRDAANYAARPRRRLPIQGKMPSETEYWKSAQQFANANGRFPLSATSGQIGRRTGKTRFP